MSASPPPWWHGILGKAMALAVTSAAAAAAAAFIAGAGFLFHLAGMPASDGIRYAMKIAAYIMGSALAIAWFLSWK